MDIKDKLNKNILLYNIYKKGKYIKINIGYIGEETESLYKDGSKIHVGDIVYIESKGFGSKNKSVICLNKQENKNNKKATAMGVFNSIIENGQVGNSFNIILIAKYNDKNYKDYKEVYKDRYIIKTIKE